MLTCSAAAIQCLTRKRLYEQQIEQLGNFQSRIHDYSSPNPSFAFSTSAAALFNDNKYFPLFHNENIIINIWTYA